MKPATLALCLATVAFAAPALSKGVDLAIVPTRPAGSVEGALHLLAPYGERYVDADFDDDDDDDLQCREMTTTTYKPNGDVIVITHHLCN